MISDTSVSDGGWGASCYQAMVDAAAEKRLGNRLYRQCGNL